MRTKFKKLISVCLAVIMLFSVLTVAPLTADAAETDSESVGDTYTSGDFEYTVLDDGTAEITGYNGSETELDIPSTLDGYTVTGIGICAFYKKASLTSVIIPNSVSKIGFEAFSRCTGLVSITIPNSVTIIEPSAFEHCISLSSITIPDSVTIIGFEAFKGCTNLESITVTDSTTIGVDAFYNTLWYNTQPDGIVYLNNIVYKYKGEMPENTTIILKDETKNISCGAFRGCTGLISVTIPYGVTCIGFGAFCGCNSIESIIIPDSVTIIGDDVFDSCTSLVDVIIGNNVTCIGNSAFIKCTSLTSIVIPNSVKTISDNAFSDCTSLESVAISDSVTEIGWRAFSDCTSLTEVTIPDSVEFIDDYALGYYNIHFDSEIMNWTGDKIDGFTIYGYADSAAETYANENGFDFVAIKEYIDVDTNISVTAGTDAELKVTEITDKNEIEKVNIKLENEKVERLYDISFVKDGTVLQPLGTTTVKIPCTNGISKVYRVETDGSLTDMNAVYDNGHMVFLTNHFSHYVLTLEKSDVLLGDVNGDGKISIDDVTDVQKYIANTITFTNEQVTLADTDKDGKVSIDDVTLIQKHLAGLAVIE